MRDALDKGAAVVALESTIIAHGMPYPQNVETAREVEDIVRQGGAVPATIAILGGEVKIGLAPDELDHLGREGRNIRKVSVSDLPFVVASGWMAPPRLPPPCGSPQWPASASLRRAASAAFTGEPRATFDISADMTEFAESGVAVVTAGAKAILDLAPDA